MPISWSALILFAFNSLLLFVRFVVFVADMVFVWPVSGSDTVVSLYCTKFSFLCCVAATKTRFCLSSAKPVACSLSCQ